jgi:hypothetical protein
MDVSIRKVRIFNLLDTFLIYFHFSKLNFDLFNRFIRSLKQKVTNQAYVEGSICKAYLLEEMSTFASYYYPPDIPSRRTRVPRNDDGGESSVNPPFSIFNYPGRHFGKCTISTLQYKEMKAAHLYILLNCPEVVPYLT